MSNSSVGSIAKSDLLPTTSRGNDRLLLGIVLGVVTFWLFAQTTLNINSAMRKDLGIDAGWMNIAVSITSLFSGIFIVVLGNLGDRIGRVKLTLAGTLLNIVGSLLIAVTPSGTAAFLISGRIIQGLSAACIMPNTLAMVKSYWEGAGRQRAVSFWSMGSWGGSGAASLFGGAIASTIGWRYIFWMSIAISIISFFLIMRTPEDNIKQPHSKEAFDWTGLISFIIALLCLNVFIGQGAGLGWTNPITLALFAGAVIFGILFFRIETTKTNSFVDLGLFKNPTYMGATLSNFLLNGSAGTIMVALSLWQQGASKTPLQAGYLTLGYLVAILVVIRYGEKLLRLWGPRKPMIIGIAITALGILLTAQAWVYAWEYGILAFIGFTFYGIGLGIYATPSTDAALSSVPTEKAGSAAGIYKMASSLGSAFGVAISAAIYSGLTQGAMKWTIADPIMVGRTDNISVRFAAMVALAFNIIMVLIALIATMATVPSGKQNEVE
ncbi:MAG: MFS transporter [Anaerolineaceae bacterium]